MLINNTNFIRLPLFVKGKVRNVYDLGDQLLIVVTDRISAFDVVFDELIPNKGTVLNSISAFWFDFTKDVIGNHVITTDVSKYPKELSAFKDELQGRSMLVKKSTDASCGMYCKRLSRRVRPEGISKNRNRVRYKASFRIKAG